jgi:dolichol-phosphate mannosyltransferase
MSTAKTLVQTATYNEMQNLPALVEAIFHFVPDVHLLVIDDNSPDGTGRWIAEQATHDERIKVIHRQGKLGLGSAIVAGLRFAMREGYEVVCNMDADFSHHPRYLPALIQGMFKQPPVDVMIGSRYRPGGGIVGWPLQRHLMSRAINAYARLLLGLQPKDCSGGFRCYRTSTLTQIDFDRIQSWGYSFQEEILWHIKRAGGRCGEAPIVFNDRQKGSSKITSKDTFSALWIILYLGWLNLLGDPSPAIIRQAR